LLFALSELKNCRRPKNPKGTAAGRLNQRPAVSAAPPQTRAGGLGKRKKEGDGKRQLPPRSSVRSPTFSLKGKIADVPLQKTHVFRPPTLGGRKHQLSAAVSLLV
jgi:hypothetical protein